MGLLGLLTWEAIKLRSAFPKETEFVERFSLNEANLASLAEMARGDLLEGFCIQGANLDRTRSKLGEARLNQYAEAMRALNLMCIHVEDGGERVSLTVWKSGFPETSSGRGYLFHSAPIHNIVECVDESRCYAKIQNRTRWTIVHRPLKDNWAIFAF